MELETLTKEAQPRLLTREIEMVSLIDVGWNSPVSVASWATETIVPVGEGDRQISLLRRWAHTHRTMAV